MTSAGFKLASGEPDGVFNRTEFLFLFSRLISSLFSIKISNRFQDNPGQVVCPKTVRLRKRIQIISNRLVGFATFDAKIAVGRRIIACRADFPSAVNFAFLLKFFGARRAIVFAKDANKLAFCLCFFSRLPRVSRLDVDHLAANVAVNRIFNHWVKSLNRIFRQTAGKLKKKHFGFDRLPLCAGISV